MKMDTSALLILSLKKTVSANVECVLQQMDCAARLLVSVCCGFVGVSHIHIALKLQPFLVVPTTASTLSTSGPLKGEDLEISADPVLIQTHSTRRAACAVA